MSCESNSVLVVEDEPSVRALVQDVLAGEGYTVLDAGDPWEALGVAQSYPIRLLVTDVGMPEMSGRELARRIADHRVSMRSSVVGGDRPPLSARYRQHHRPLLYCPPERTHR